MAEFRVDELAHQVGTSVRNVRVYQERGLLPPPRRVGRNGIYGDSHLRRLRLIRALLERGYTFATISELLDAWSAGQGLSDIFGIDNALAVPWSDEEPAYVDTETLTSELGTQVGAEELHQAIQLGLISLTEHGVEIPSPRLLDAGSQLIEAGVPLPAILDLVADLKVHLDSVAQLLFAMFNDHIAHKERGTEEITATLLQLRPLAKLAVDALLTLALTEQSAATLSLRADLRAEEKAGPRGTDQVDEEADRTRTVQDSPADRAS